MWYTGLQKIVATQWSESEEVIATSSANAETIATSETLVRALHLTYIAEEVGIRVDRPIQIQIDANAALGFLNNTGGSSKMKHLDIRKDWIQQLRERDLAEFIKVKRARLIPSASLIDCPRLLDSLVAAEFHEARQGERHGPDAHHRRECRASFQRGADRLQL